MSALNSVAASSPSALSMQQTVVDAMAELAAKIQALVNGSMSVEQFLGSTKSGGYLAASGSAPAAGGSAAAAAGGQSGSNAVSVGTGEWGWWRCAACFFVCQLRRFCLAACGPLLEAHWHPGCLPGACRV